MLLDLLKEKGNSSFYLFSFLELYSTMFHRQGGTAVWMNLKIPVLVVKSKHA